MTRECYACRHGVTCAACLDFVHTAHLANGQRRADHCVRCTAAPINRSSRRDRE